jgi:hypothetical protein
MKLDSGSGGCQESRGYKGSTGSARGIRVRPCGLLPMCTGVNEALAGSA